MKKKIQIWKWFKSASDKIDQWNFSPSMKATMQKLNDSMPEVISKALLSYVKMQYEKSEDIAQASLRSLKATLNEIID